MKGLYESIMQSRCTRLKIDESILDSDDRVKERSKQAVIYNLLNSIEYATRGHNFNIITHDDTKTIYGSCTYVNSRDLLLMISKLHDKLVESFGNKVSYSRIALQLSVDFIYNNSEVKCSFFCHNEKRNTRLVMNIDTKDMNTYKTIKNIFDKEIPF